MSVPFPPRADETIPATAHEFFTMVCGFAVLAEQRIEQADALHAEAEAHRAEQGETARYHALWHEVDQTMESHDLAVDMLVGLLTDPRYAAFRAEIERRLAPGGAA